MTISQLKTMGAAAMILGVIGLGVGGLITRAPGDSVQDAPPVKEAGNLVTERVDVSPEDLISATGLDLYKFQLQLQKGERFRVVYRKVDRAGSPAHDLVDRPLEATGDGPVTVRVSFMRTDRKLQGFLLSTEAQAEYRLQYTGCTQTGIVTIVDNPLGDLTRRGLYIYQSKQTPLAAGHGEVLLLRVCADNAPRGVDVEGYPRAEVVVVKDNQGGHPGEQ